MFYLWRRCVGSARLQLRLFDLLSLEDVQYLSVRFPIILPMDRSNSFPTSESGNYHGFLIAHICEGNDTVIPLKFSFCWRSFLKILEAFARMPVVSFENHFHLLRVQSTL